MTDTRELIARLEAGEGADRELDADIMILLGGAERIDASTFYGPGAKVWSFGEYEEEGGAWNGPLPRLTASLDAALALVEEVLPGAEWALERLDRNCTFELGDPALRWTGEALTPARAVLIALLRAKEGEHD